jgi:hypothetical protein
MSFTRDGLILVASDVKKRIRILVSKLITKALLVRTRLWEKNIKMDLEEVLIVTEEPSVDLDSCLHLGKLTVHCL